MAVTSCNSCAFIPVCERNTGVTYEQGQDPKYFTYYNVSKCHDFFDSLYLIGPLAEEEITHHAKNLWPFVTMRDGFIFSRINTGRYNQWMCPPKDTMILVAKTYDGGKVLCRPDVVNSQLVVMGNQDEDRRLTLSNFQTLSDLNKYDLEITSVLVNPNTRMLLNHGIFELAVKDLAIRTGA